MSSNDYASHIISAGYDMLKSGLKLQCLLLDVAAGPFPIIIKLSLLLLVSDVLPSSSAHTTLALTA